MNVSRVKLKTDCIEKYFSIIKKTKFEGMKERYIAKTKFLINVLLGYRKVKKP